MLTWFLNPWMLCGGLAIAAPILIHLLNKRRFKIVEWAAMDFLFEADKKNRRRVQLENLILLALRCLAMLLVALLLARPFLPSGLTGVLQQTQKFERIILIDDSLSQRVLNNSQPALEMAKASAAELLSRLANSDKTENWLTVMVTSRPDQPLLANEPLTANTLATLTQTIDDLTVADTVADYSQSLIEFNRYLSGLRENVSRVAYVYSDLRERDWVLDNSTDTETTPSKLLNEVADTTLGCFLIDVGSPQDDNLAVVEVRPDGLLVADKTIRFNVSVANFGSQTVEDVRVLLQIDDGQPKFETLAAIAPGQTQEVSFLHVFPNSTQDLGLLEEAPESKLRFSNYRIRAEIDRQSLGENNLSNDQLLEDGSSLFAARVIDGVSVLLVDGDPSAASERSETHYLRSLDVLGTGLDAEIATVSELETVSLNQYQVIFLCNVDEASPDRIASLERWVNDGGSLVLMPGNRVRAATYNAAFHKNGNGLSPLELTTIAGDPTMAKWVNFEIDAQIHPALQVIVDSDVSSLSNVDVFSWWKSELPVNLIGKSIAVPLRLNDEDNSPAMVERRSGDGKIIVFTIPGDGDWTMWPSSPTFAPVMIDLIDYLVGTEIDNSNVPIGGAITYPVDLTLYQNRVGLRDPNNEKIEAIARPTEAVSKPVLDSGALETVPPTTSAGESNPTTPGTTYSAQFGNLLRRGFYSLELARHSGETDRVLFASNYDSRESRLTRLSAATLDGGLFSSKVSRVSVDQLNSQTVSGGNSEIWLQLLMALFGVLVVEQFLGWWWGRKR